MDIVSTYERYSDYAQQILATLSQTLNEGKFLLHINNMKEYTDYGAYPQIQQLPIVELQNLGDEAFKQILLSNLQIRQSPTVELTKEFIKQKLNKKL